VEYEGSVYHVIRRANARREIVKESDDWARAGDRPGQTVERFR
jgi:hypothetical protein